MFSRWCFGLSPLPLPLLLLFLLLVCCTVDLSSTDKSTGRLSRVSVLAVTAAPPPLPCPTEVDFTVTCLYVAPPTYNFSSSVASHALGASDNPFDSLSAAIQAANSSSMANTYLILYAGTYSGSNNNNLNTVGKNLVLVSYDYFSNSMALADAAGGTTIDGGAFAIQGGTRCITVSQGVNSGVSTVSIIAITISNCVGSYGPAITVTSGCVLNLNGVSVISNFASASGGAIFGDFGTINIANSQFIGNKAVYNGGALYFLGCDVTISDSALQFCRAENGGVGYLEGGTLTMTGSTFMGNTADNSGGGFSLSAVQTNVSNCQFMTNSGFGGGGNSLEMVGSTLYCTDTYFSSAGIAYSNDDGAVRLLNQPVTIPGVNNYIINCEFSDSQGLRFSGVSLEDTNVGPNPSLMTYIINTKFTGNYAYGDVDTTGGALHASNSAYNCSGCIFTGNFGAQFGAAAVCENGAACVFENSVFEENYAWGGAAVYVAASVNGPSANPTSSAYIVNCTFINNVLRPTIEFYGLPSVTAPGFPLLGGAVFIGTGSQLYFVNGLMVNNSADYGGAIYVDSNFGDIELSNILLEDNHAAIHGGAIYLANFPDFTNVSAEPNITFLTFMNNVAVRGGGGAIFVAQGASNYSPALYGAEVVRNKTQVCSLCTYIGNRAPYGNDLATDPFKLNIQVSEYPISMNMNVINSVNAINGTTTDSISILSGSTIYVSAVLVDFFDQRVSMASGLEVAVAATNGILSNLIMTGVSTSSNATSTNVNILLESGSASFSLSLLSYPNSQASLSVSVPQEAGVAAATVPLAISACASDEYVNGVSGSAGMAVCSAIAHMPSGGKAAAIAVIAVSYLVLALFFLFFVAFRNHRVVYQSSIVFCMLIMLGLAMVNTAALLSALDKTVNTCTARIFLLHLGFAFAIGSVSVKLFRLQLIFNNPLLVMLKLSDTVMLWRLLVVLVLNVAPVIVWTVVDPFQSSGLNQDACTSSNSLAYEISLLCFNGFVLFSSAYFAFSLRNTPSQYNETTSMALLNYVMLVLGIVWVLLRWSGNLSNTSQSLAEAFLLTFAALLTSCILFGPKVFLILRSLISRAARMSSQEQLPSTNKRGRSCCWVLISGYTGKPVSERLHSDHSLTATRVSTPGGQNHNHQVVQNNGMELDDFAENAQNNGTELNTVMLDKIAALKERLQSRVGALKHNVRQVASAERDVREIIVLLGSACSEYQFLHSRGGGGTAPGKDPMELVNDPIFMDAANAISRAHGVYLNDSANGTGNGSSRNERKLSNKSQGQSRRSNILTGMTPTHGESKQDLAPGRTAPLSARSIVGKPGRSSESSAAFAATVTSMPSKLSLALSHDSGMEQAGAGSGRLSARPSVPLENERKDHAALNSARVSDSSRMHRNGNGSTNDQIELEQLTVQR